MQSHLPTKEDSVRTNNKKQLEVISLDMAKALMVKAVAAYGEDWVDPNAGVSIPAFCKNTYEYEGRTCHCLIGWMLTEHGHDLTHLNNSVGITAVALGNGDWRNVLTPDAFDFMIQAQAAQDSGDSWGQILHNLKSHQPPV
jgi:hypothetical protein